MSTDNAPTTGYANLDLMFADEAKGLVKASKLADTGAQLDSGLGELIGQMLRSEKKTVSVADIDALIADIDRRVSLQMDEILHAPAFKAMESAWRGLEFLVKRTDFTKNNRVSFFDATKDELAEDFENAPDLRSSKLCRMVFEEEYATFGGSPVGAIIGNYNFGPSSPDMALLRKVASVASQAHAPFIAAAGTEFFGVKDFTEIPRRGNVSTRMHAKWVSFRETCADANYVGLTMPRFILRLPYDPKENPVKSFVYREVVTDDHEKYCWGNAAFAFATRLTESFARYGWCPNIIGPRGGGAVLDLPLSKFENLGELETKPPTECSLSGPREKELADEGFIPFTWRKDTDNACFFSANSAQKPKFFGNNPEDKRAETNYKLGTQLPYLFIVSRLAHHISVFQREELGSSKSRSQMEGELNKWVTQYVSRMDGASADVMARRPFRDAKLAVEDIEGEPGWYRVAMQLRPHLKYMGAYFDLSLVGTIESKK